INNYPTMQGESTGLDFSIALGNRRSILPYTVIVNRSGEIVARHTGEATREQLLNQINPLL
ncbi:MAG: TlpA family protein disulfide reductase, partial [Gammaproteobacteria bacterium]|nr:TlpA family protein disulfide reductase [Gammaproteobacteria bacterium]